MNKIQRGVYIDPDLWHQVKVKALEAGTSASEIVEAAVGAYIGANPLPAATVSPLRMKVEPDGAISQVSGGPLDELVVTRPWREASKRLIAEGADQDDATNVIAEGSGPSRRGVSSFGAPRPAPKGGRR